MLRIMAVLSLIVLLDAALAAAQPSTAPTTEPLSDIQIWLNQLADGDETVREQARFNLMGLTRGQLDVLRAAVEQSLPLAPSQRVALHDIVQHVYLTGEPYDAMRGNGFLGIFAGDPRLANTDQIGLLVTDTMPGFCAFRALRAGDVIIRVTEYPDITIRDASHLSDAIRNDAGRRLHLEVFRRGQMVRVAVTIDPRPASLSGAAGINELLNQRSAKSEKYWQETFAPLIQPKATSGGVSLGIVPTENRINFAPIA